MPESYIQDPAVVIRLDCNPDDNKFTTNDIGNMKVYPKRSSKYTLSMISLVLQVHSKFSSYTDRLQS